MRNHSKKKLKKQRRKQHQHDNAPLSNTRRDESHHSTNETITSGPPPPIVSGSRKRVRNIVEFVYPKDSANERKPYVFDKQQQKASSSSSTPSRGHEEEANGNNKKPKLTTESIDDILFRKEREKQKHQTVDEPRRKLSEELPSNEQTRTKRPARESSSDASHADDTKEGKLSGLSVEDAVRDKVGCRPRANSTDGELNLPRRGLCDERMVLESHRWKNNSPSGNYPPKGFMNLGNTCFLNATLQCLAYLPTFSQTIMSLPATTARGTNGRKPTNKGQKMTAMLGSLFRQVHGLTSTGGGESSHAISPRGIVKAVPTLGTGGSRSGYKFRPGQQEDAHELLVHLLDAMQDGELKAAGINQHASGWRDRLPIPRLDETTFINRIFGGYLRSQVRCTKCGYRSNTYDPFLDLSLEVSKKSSSSVASAFSEFTRKETLDSRNRWKCSGCKKHVCANKQLTVFRPPLSLCIQLKRFTYSSGGFGGFGGWGFGHYSGKGMAGRGGSKISKPIEFPASLKLPLSDGRNCEYNLTGVVAHIGGSASSGHYTAFVKKPGNHSGNHQWYHMDDSSVEPVSEKTVLRQKDAYVLFYCRKEVKIEYPSPPPREFLSAEAAKQSGLARARARSNSHDMGESTVTATKIESSKTSTPMLGVKVKAQCSAGLDEPTRAQNDDNRDSSVASNTTPIGDAKLTTTSSAKPKEASHPADTNSLPKPDRKPLHESDDSSKTDGNSSSGSEDDSSSSESTSSKSSEPGDEEQDQGDTRSTMPATELTARRGDDGAEEQRATLALSVQNKEDADIRPDKSNKDDGATSKTRAITKKNDGKSRVVVDHGGTRGKLEVMLGPRHASKSWKPKAAASRSRDQQHELLGSVKVGKWDDDDDEGEEHDGDIPTPTSKPELSQFEQRANAIKQLDGRERSRKRKMYLDRWDAMLDEGKKKKVKEKQDVIPMAVLEPKKNPFHRIQSSMQRMNRGKAKGFRGHNANQRTHRKKNRR